MIKDRSLGLYKGHGTGPEAMPDSGGWLRVPEGQNELIIISGVATHPLSPSPRGAASCGTGPEGPWGAEETALGALGSDNRSRDGGPRQEWPVPAARTPLLAPGQRHRRGGDSGGGVTDAWGWSYGPRGGAGA